MMNVLHADGQCLFVQSLKHCFDDGLFDAYQHLGGVYSGDLLIEKLDDTQTHILLMDLNLPIKDGLSVLPDVRAAFPKLRILILTHYIAPKLVRKAMKNGADGYMLKSSTLAELKGALDELVLGNVFIDDKINLIHNVPMKFDEHFEDEFSLKIHLTPREQEILGLIAQSLTNREIGDQLFISMQTVSVHRKNLMKKMKVHDTAALVRKALRYNLIQLD